MSFKGISRAGKQAVTFDNYAPTCAGANIAMAIALG